VPPPDQDPTSLKERLAWEKELLGVYLGEHPLVALAAQLGSQVTVALSEVNEEFAGQRATLGGLIASSRTISTKSGQSMLYAELEDLGGSIEVVVFPRLLEQTRDLWADDAIVLVTGKIEQRAERWQLVCDSAQLLGDGASGPARQQLRIAVPQLGDLAASRGKLERVSEALHQHTGDDLVQISISTSQGDVLLATPNLRTSACAALLQRLQLLLGPDTVSVQRLGTPALAVAS
jgi:DNA polymerase-3 subunit alpha